MSLCAPLLRLLKKTRLEHSSRCCPRSAFNCVQTNRAKLFLWIPKDGHRVFPLLCTPWAHWVREVSSTSATSYGNGSVRLLLPPPSLSPPTQAPFLCLLYSWSTSIGATELSTKGKGYSTSKRPKRTSSVLHVQDLNV